MDKPTKSAIEIRDLPKRNRGQVQAKFKKLVIEANRFKVDVSKLSCLCIFAYKFVSEKKEERVEQRLQIIEEILPQIKEFIHGPIIKDGLIFSHKPPKVTDKTIKHGDYIVIFRQISRFNAAENPKMLLYFLGNVMKKVMEKLNFIEVGNTRKFINMHKNIQVQNVLVYSGFKAHFQLLQSGYYLTVDTTKKIVRNQSVLDYINYLYKSHDSLERNQKREAVRKNLLNKTVLTNYGKTRYLRIEDVLFVDLTQVVIESCQMLLPAYYKHRYDYEIRNLKQPLLYANNKKSKFKTYLVPELCLMTGLPEQFDQATNKYITEFSRVDADTRKVEIENFVQSMKKKEGDLIFPALGVEISQKPEKVQAKLIPPPKILVGQGKSIVKGRQSSFSLQDMPIFRVKQSTKLGIITFDDVDSSSIIDYFYKSFKSLKMKIEISIIKADTANCKRGIDALSDYIAIAKDKEACNFCLIIIPNKMRNLYQKIKQATLLEKEIGCQVVLESTLKIKNIMSVALKIMLQVLAKAGNTIWLVVPEYRKEKIMFVAFYTTDLSKVKNNMFTIGICATCDEGHAELFSKTRQYAKQHEELHAMKELMLEALAVYKKKNNSVPTDIIIIENQKSTKTEQSATGFFIEPLIKMMQEYYGLKRPCIIYIIVSKCLNHRFFRMFEGKCTNPPIGTLINRQVTSNKHYDFYMVAHNICKKGGSITPLNYKIIYSDSNLEEGILQSMLFGQCFNYPNFTGAIKQPAILQSATKCTKFGAEVLCQVADRMQVYPYYL